MPTVRKPIVREEVEARHAAGESWRSIAISLGVTKQSLDYHRRNWGHVPDPKFSRPSGPDSKSWRGGSFIDRWGYRMVLTPDNPRCNKYVPEHILVAERTAGRPLASGEVVHHINGVKLDNRPENLLICTRAEHRSLHAQLEEIAYTLIAEGRIRFDGSRYRLD